MRLAAEMTVRRPLDVVWEFLASDPANLTKWDRGVRAVRVTSETPAGVGLTFDTLGFPRGRKGGGESGRMSYRVTEFVPRHHMTVALASSGGNARYFRRAAWRMQVEAAGGETTRVICVADFALRRRYLLLAPVLYAMRGAIQRDLGCLRRAVETG